MPKTIVSFRSIQFPSTYQYAADSDHIPIEFYEEVLPISKKIDLFLGYFTSNAIKALSRSFAEFIFNGGEMRLITNHYVTLDDFQNIYDPESLENEDKVIDIFSDIELLQQNLSHEGRHFFDCLKYLIKEKRLQVIPVKFSGENLAHCKRGLFYDGNEWILTNGSINFTLPGIIKNAESFVVETPWNGPVSVSRIEDELEKFKIIFEKKHPLYKYLNKNQLEVIIQGVGRKKEIHELLDDSISLPNNNYGKKVREVQAKKYVRFQKIVEDLKSTPRFPGEGPRNYQVEAYENWLKNDCSGIFAMATGTGKTITALNCVFEEYLKTTVYQSIVLVPTTILQHQWKAECLKFNFTNTFSSEESNWESKLSRLIFLSSNDFSTESFFFVTTYSTYNSNKFQRIIKGAKMDSVILIADEVHNLGSANSLKNLPHNIKKRIGLSATPNRKYDDQGSKEIEKFFNSFSPGYCFSYSMSKAINEGRLCHYEYYPYLTTLTYDELNSYRKLSYELLKHFDFKKGEYRESAKKLLIKRKRIIHSASNKKEVFKEILLNLKAGSKGEKLKHILVYVPEGYDHSYEESSSYEIEAEDKRIIDDYSKIVHELGFTTHQVLAETKNRKEILNRFEEGKISVLTSMKTLDEGVDIPATKYAIFCASTGNPRQFIQRRGRILRSFKGKDMAIVYDIIISPNPQLWENEGPENRNRLRNMEINIFKSEIYRIANFLYASDNRSDLSVGKDLNLKRIRSLAETYNINLDGMINELISIDNQ